MSADIAEILRLCFILRRTVFKKQTSKSRSSFFTRTVFVLGFMPYILYNIILQPSDKPEAVDFVLIYFLSD